MIYYYDAILGLQYYSPHEEVDLDKLVEEWKDSMRSIGIGLSFNTTETYKLSLPILTNNWIK